MMLSSKFTAAGQVSRASVARRSMTVRALPFNISIPKFGARKEEFEEEEEEEEVPKTRGFSLPFDLPFGRSSEEDAPAPAPVKRAAAPKKAVVKAAPKVAAKAKKGYVYEYSAPPSLTNNDFSTVEMRRPIGGKLRPVEDIDLDAIKPSIWERWGSGKA